VATVELTDANIEEVLSANDKVVIDVWADWCPPCKRFGPIFESVSDQYEDVLFAKVNADQNPGILNLFQIYSIPTILVVSGPNVLFRRAGILSEDSLKFTIDGLLYPSQGGGEQ
jgi:thioredoxin